MNAEKVDHSLNKGYPYGTIISMERFKNRISPLLHTENYKVSIEVDQAVYPSFKGIKPWHRWLGGAAIDFLLFRTFDYAEALTVAEGQIQALQNDDMPFIPEDFEFYKAVKPKDISDNPATIYISRFDDTISLYRNINTDCGWVILKRVEDAFTEMHVKIPNHRIAYALFYSLDIKVEEKVINSVLKSKYSAVYEDDEKNVIKIDSFESDEKNSIQDAYAIIRKMQKSKTVIKKERITVTKL